ncbi:glycoside hydrolase family 13 protein [Allofournierella massiliensis]|uniref:Alpha-glucosidase n=1 Tax=Allofournierella massiliensis TaxID=1650663 RepID=A0ABT7UQQ8_9FIRM|nr:alpha-glucosidase [Fournierella massiliensis]MDM8201222.1 alpha-glucosidase [Fournierella massiliensis]
MLDKTKKDWWKSAVAYQIYPKSFQDTTGSGVGDLQGIIKRLDYLKTLGIDVIWLSPVCASPQVDNGYDISDYRAIDPMFGDLDDMRQLIQEGKKRGIGIMMDLVLNHSSDQHRWFLEAKTSRDNPYHDYYVWRDGTPDAFPNDMQATFGGPAWEWVPEVGQYYFHQFAPQQPDLNWENPALRREIYDMILWWMEQGVEGFRLDVIDQIAKEPDNKITNNGPRLHEFLRELSAETFQKGCLVTVGEAWGADIPRAKLYSAPDGSELSMVFQFEQMVLDQQPGKDKWDLAPLPFVKMKQSYARWQQGLHGCGWNSLFLDNHDLPRIVSRWGDDGEYRVQSAKLLATMLHGMQGTPYIYQGEELGMTNVRLPLEQYQDVEIHNMYKKRLAEGYPEEEILRSIYAKGRDNARTPMQWNGQENAGFTTGTPWLPVNPNYTSINAEAALADPDSVFWYYKKLIALRKEYPVFVEGDFTLLEEEHPQLFVYRRSTKNEQILVVCNFSGTDVSWSLPGEWTTAEMLISNYPSQVQKTLRPWEATILHRAL